MGKRKRKKKGKLFILYNGRAKLGDTQRASICVTAFTEEEARKDGEEPSWHDGIWYEYDCVDIELRNGKPRWDIPPNSIKKGKNPCSPNCQRHMTHPCEKCGQQWD